MPSPTPAHRVSLRDVARAVGVSHVAISLALRDDPRISEARRREIRAAAERLGYRPDPMLASLAAYRKTRRGTPIRSTIAWINQWPEPRGLRRLLEFDAYWKGAAATAEELGYRLDEVLGGRDVSPERLEKILHSRGVRGILIPPHRDGFSLQGFDWSKFSVVRLGVSVAEPRAHVVSNDQLNSARLAFERVRERGYRRIGFVTSRRFDHSTGGNFRAGFLAAQDAAVRPKQCIALLYLDEPTTADDVERVRSWLKSAAVDAVITSHPALRKLLGQIGVRVPADLGVAVTSVLDGNFDAGIDQNCLEIGRVAMRTLAGLIHQNERGVPQYCRRILVESGWVDGESLPRKSERGPV
jgi:LacI family transcriptional regulator